MDSNIRPYLGRSFTNQFHRLYKSSTNTHIHTQIPLISPHWEAGLITPDPLHLSYSYPLLFPHFLWHSYCAHCAHFIKPQSSRRKRWGIDTKHTYTFWEREKEREAAAIGFVMNAAYCKLLSNHITAKAIYSSYICKWHNITVIWQCFLASLHRRMIN